MSKRKEFIENALANAEMARALTSYYMKLAKWAQDHYGSMSDEDFEALTNGSTPPPPPPKVPPE